MPALKLTKDITTHLFKYVKKVDIQFNPFDSRTRSARELMRQVQAQRFVKANPKLKIGTHVVGTAEPPKVDFEFIDGTKKTYDSQNYQVKEILEDVFMTANNMDISYELEGKSVDDK